MSVYVSVRSVLGWCGYVTEIVRSVLVQCYVGIRSVLG